MVVAPFTDAINQICEEKGLDRTIVVEAVEAALAAAYRKDYGSPRWIVRSQLNETDLAQSTMRRVWSVVKKDELEDEEQQIAISDAKKRQSGVKVGEEISEALPPQADFGRIAAQTAKQVILQKIREAEKDAIIGEYQDKIGSLVNGMVLRFDGQFIICDIGGSFFAMFPPYDLDYILLCHEV